MKKLIILSLGAVALTAGISSCKKGENDPFLSMKSRKSRLAGEWTVTKMEGTKVEVETFSVGGDDYTMTTTTTTTYDGANEVDDVKTETSSSMGTVTENDSYSNPHTVSYTFDKDGTFKMVDTDTDDGDVNTIEGTWAFVGKSKTAELKNKEAISLFYNKMTTTSGSTTSTSTVTGQDWPSIMVIDQLKSKEIVFIYETVYTDANGDTETTNMKTTLTAK